MQAQPTDHSRFLRRSTSQRQPTMLLDAIQDTGGPGGAIKGVSAKRACVCQLEVGCELATPPICVSRVPAPQPKPLTKVERVRAGESETSGDQATSIARQQL